MRFWILPLILAAMSSLASGSDYGHEEEHVYAVESALVLTTENGMGGVCSIKYVLAVQMKNGSSVYYLFANREEFEPFVRSIREVETPVVAEFEGYEISVALTSSASGDRLFGHLIGTGDKVVVLPEPISK